MNIKKLLKGGNSGKLFPLFVIGIFIYIIETVIFYIYNSLLDMGGLHYMNKPLFLYIIKWIYAVLLLWGILNFSRKPTFYWIIISFTSISILLLAIPVSYTYLFYSSSLDKFLLELISIVLLIYINSGVIINRYKIHRKLINILILIIPFILTFGISEILRLYINSL